MGNSQDKNQDYQNVSQRPDSQRNNNSQNKNALMRKIQSLYPQISNKELEIFANQNKDMIFWSVQDHDFEKKLQKSLEKHFRAQESKYNQLIERLYAHRQAQMKDVSLVNNQFIQSDQLNDQDMRIIFENASLLEKIDKMKDFFLIKHNNPLQLSLHVTFLANTFKQIIDLGEKDEDFYVTIVKGYTQFPSNLSKLMCLCGFIEFNEDGQTIGLYYQKRNPNLIKTLYRYLKQKYHTNIKQIDTIIKEISEQQSFKHQSTGFSLENYQKQQFNNLQISQNQAQNLKEQVQQQNQINQNYNIDAQQQSRSNNSSNSQQKSEDYQKYKEQYEKQYQKKELAGKITLSQNPIYQQISTVVQSKQIQERVKAQIEARQRREEKNKSGQGKQNQTKSKAEDLLFDESNLTVQTSQQSAEVSQFELQDLNPKETPEMRMSRAIIDLINQYRKQNNMLQLQFSQNIMPTCEYHSRNIANNEAPFGHDGFEGRVREISLYADFVLVCESVVQSTTPVDCQKLVTELINNERHKKNLLSPTTHACAGVYSKQNSAFITIIFYKSR
ncbi:SCP-like extracellular protein, putative (macronuclear) [Tetrahymena thermophila SB210]|uniref:SCP-like extracellular protein, putative n=1 Tax=Tetrahymena thermophila (strain SB210) TaxID=312017 RepID=I7MEC7_TETTS|nr:SCP-like extracellular protein, putative [Tetrahymena thermophila SB210]EAR96081.2 SCP-like extracellular protein, putative [Tetrahymena thermophila SB210]|eukprot:XP_001016326.2 SCP-like extracellular protein, putative [Tetrahymena thermophila SB210]